MKHAKLIYVIGISVLSLAYLVSFAFLTTHGGYTLMPSGTLRPLNGLATADTWVWQPLHGTYHQYQSASGDKSNTADFWGYFYSPLILLDQHFIHPTKTARHREGHKTFVPSPDEMHPTFLAIWNKEAAQ